MSRATATFFWVLVLGLGGCPEDQEKEIEEARKEQSQAPDSERIPPITDLPQIKHFTVIVGEEKIPGSVTVDEAISLVVKTDSPSGEVTFKVYPYDQENLTGEEIGTWMGRERGGDVYGVKIPMALLEAHSELVFSARVTSPVNGYPNTRFLYWNRDLRRTVEQEPGVDLHEEVKRIKEETNSNSSGG